MIKTKYLKKIINYDGSQLSPHFIFKNFGIQGDAIISFRGKCDILPQNIIDLKDVKEKKKIYSEDMLHFIGEFFSYNLFTTVLIQRLFISIIKDEIAGQSGKNTIVRWGDDIFDEDNKISISVATASGISTLFHIGINLSSKNTPVKTKGLDDYNISGEKFSHTVLKKFSEEISESHLSKCKVNFCK